MLHREHTSDAGMLRCCVGVRQIVRLQGNRSGAREQAMNEDMTSRIDLGSNHLYKKHIVQEPRINSERSGHLGPLTPILTPNG